MTLIHRLVSVGRWLLRRDAVERELEDELQTFVDLSAADKMRDGLGPTEARRLALAELGGLEQAKERVRTYRHGALLDDIGRDVRHAIRMFGRDRGFTIVVVLTLALGIGANTAIFTLIDALMLRSLPVPNPQQLVQVKFRPSDGSDFAEIFSYAIVRALAEQHEIFAGVAGFSGTVLDIGAPGAISRVPGAIVTGGYYETLGLTPAIGRLLTRADDERGAPPAAVISDGYWERQFARSPAVIGQRLVINGMAVGIVGVSPRGFVGASVGSVADVTLTVAALPRVRPDAAGLLGTGNFWLRALARLRPGVPRAAAQARLQSVWPRICDPLIAPHWPPSQRTAMAESVFQLSPGGTGSSYLRHMYTKPLMVLMAMVGLVLLIACANVATLLLARATARQKEIAVRLALGAGRGRILRQLLIEGTLLSLTGAACGIAVAWFASRFLVTLISNGSDRAVFDLAPNSHILAFTGAMAMATGTFFGVMPVLRATPAQPSLALKEDGRTSSSRSRLLPALVSVQVALSLVLLVGAGLFVRTLQNLHNFDPGFRSEGVLLVDLDPQAPALLQEMLDDIRTVPRVVSASVSSHTPLSGSVWSEPAVPAGQPLPERDTAVFVAAGPGFFATMGIPLLAGREFTEADSADRPAVAIVNEQFARRYFAARNPLGQHLSAKVRGRQKDLEVVGIAKDIYAVGLRKAPPRAVYVSYAQLTETDFPVYPTLEIRAAGSLAEASAGVRQIVQRRLPAAVIEVRTLSTQVNATLVQERMMATLAAAFGLLALVLACIGLSGLLAYSVARRIKEIGIRMALGAGRAQVLAHVLRGAAGLLVIGIAVGLPAAWVSSRLVASMLFQLTPADPAVTAGAIALLTAVALLAACVPAERAAGVDPLTALRHE